MKRTLSIWAVCFVAVGFLVLLFIGPDLTLHRRAAITAYTKWINNPNRETKAAWERELNRNLTIQLEVAAVGSVIICSIAFGLTAGVKWIMARRKG